MPPRPPRPRRSTTPAEAPRAAGRGAARTGAPRPAASYDLFAATAPGLEALAAAELSSLGMAGRPEEGGVAFAGPFADVVRANLHLRTASRVLARVASFRATAFHELERLARAIAWERFVAPGAPVRFTVTSRKSRLYHSDAVAERFAGAVAHRLGKLPATPPPGPDDDAAGDTPDDAAQRTQLFVVRFVRDVCTVSADTSGELLHRRGHRLQLARAPLRETLAAAMLLGSGYTGAGPLLDPLCGSGTLLIEGALIARRIAPGLHRSFRCADWPEADAAVVRRARDAAAAAVLDAAPAPIVGSDRDAGAIDAARANATRAGVAGDLELETRALSAIHPPPGVGLLATNPPYGVRVGEESGLRDLYARLGQVARSRLAGWRVAVLSANPRLDRQIRLPLEERWRSTNGGIPVRLIVADVPETTAQWEDTDAGAG